jgi:molybdopterin-guanine dinucleotide biosynthesis protein A
MIEAVAGVVLAGGLARRMGGGDKGLINLGGKPILAHVIERFKPQTEALIINANGELERFAAYELPVVPDSIGGWPGPLAGVLAGLDWAAGEGFSHIVTAATDTPFFPRDLVAQFKAVVENKNGELAVAQSGCRTHPVFGFWPVVLRDDLRAALMKGVRKVDEWTGRHRLAVAQFDTSPYDPFFNVNRPEDMGEAEAILNTYGP